MLRKVTYASLIVFVVLGIVGMVLHHMKLNRPISQEQSEKGNFLPAELKLTSFESGEEVSLETYKNKVLLINFWASWCGPCLAELPGIQKLYQEMKKDGLEVIAINVDENPAREIPKIKEKLGLNLPIFTDKDAELSELFEVSAIPFTIVTNRKHEIIWSESGEKDWFSEKVIQEMRELLKED